MCIVHSEICIVQCAKCNVSHTKSAMYGDKLNGSARPFGLYIVAVSESYEGIVCLIETWHLEVF